MPTYKPEVRWKVIAAKVTADCDSCMFTRSPATMRSIRIHVLAHPGHTVTATSIVDTVYSSADTATGVGDGSTRIICAANVEHAA